MAELLMALREELKSRRQRVRFLPTTKSLDPLVNCIAWRRYHRRHSLNLQTPVCMQCKFSVYQQAVRSTMVLSLTELIYKNQT